MIHITADVCLWTAAGCAFALYLVNYLRLRARYRRQSRHAAREQQMAEWQHLR